MSKWWRLVPYVFKRGAGDLVSRWWPALSLCLLGFAANVWSIYWDVVSIVQSGDPYQWFTLAVNGLAAWWWQLGIVRVWRRRELR